MISPEIEIFETLDSTNLELKRQFQTGLDIPKWVLTHRQTAGYGRRNRAWEQATGDFAGSLFVPLKVGRSDYQPANLSFAASVAVLDTLVHSGVRPEQISLKWPNDVLVCDRKISGLLLELVEERGRRAVIIGIGINIVSAPEIAVYPTTRLMNHLQGATRTPEKLLERLSPQLQTRIQIMEREGFEPVRREWISVAKGIGEPITVRLPGKTLQGVFHGMSGSGALRLETATGIQEISAGEVYFGDSAAQ